MPTLRIAIPQIRPVKLTIPRFDPDEIYLAYIVHLGRVADEIDDSELSWAAGRLSTIHATGAKPPLKTWKPTSSRARQGINDEMAVEVDMDDANVAVVQMYLYERDDADIWNKLEEQAELRDIVKPKAMNWKKVPLPKSCSGSASGLDKFACVARQVARYAAIAAPYLRQDDFLGEQRLVIPIDSKRESDSDLGVNVWTFKKSGGRYEVTTDIAMA